jgi:hypothetical protein
MSDEGSKMANSKRRYRDEVAIKRQLKILRSNKHASDRMIQKDERQPNRLSKHHAMDCGNPLCYICGNPRKTHKDKLTQQEKRMYQDIDKPNNRHNNGTISDEE